MRGSRTLRMVGYGSSLALLLAAATAVAPSDNSGREFAFAQGTGQPAPAPSPAPVPGQTGATDRIVLDIYIGDGGMPASGEDAGNTDEGGDIGEGLSNQLFDPDD